MIRRIGLLMLSGMLLAGCANLSGAAPNFWALIEKRGQAEPKLTDYEQGKRYLQLGSLGLAINAFQKELAEKPNSIPALNGLAVAYDRLGRGDVAQRYLDLALTLDPKSAVTLNNLAYLNLTQGNTAVAVGYGERAREAAGAGEMQLPPSIAAAVANNLAFANALAMSELRDMASKETLEALEITPDIERIGTNEWQIHLPPVVEVSHDPGLPSAVNAATASKSADWLAQLSHDSRIRVSNGTGRNLMAARFAGYLSGHGLKVRQLANAPRFDYRQSVLYYNPDQHDFAVSLSRLLPFPIRLTEATKGNGGVEIVFGSDLLGFDDGLHRT
jgi:tetratricopeptide (TPR) repeat protein